MLAYTWNDRDDYDIRSIQWDRWRALETGDPYAGYGPQSVGTIYAASGDNNLRILAANGYTDYFPNNVAERAAAAGVSPTTAVAGFLMGDYSDDGRVFGPVSYLGPQDGAGRRHLRTNTTASSATAAWTACCACRRLHG